MNDGVRNELSKLIGSLRMVHADMANCQALVDMPRYRDDAEQHLVAIERLLENVPTGGLPANEVTDQLGRIEESIAEFRRELSGLVPSGPKKGGPVPDPAPAVDEATPGPDLAP
jgi:hypothetical protein